MMGLDARPFHARHQHHGQRRAVTAVFAVLVSVLQAAPVQAQETEDTPFVYSSPNEWGMGPLNGYGAWRTATIASERLRRFPASPNTVGWLLQAKRVDDAFAVVQRIIETRPEAIAQTFQAGDWLDVRGDQTRGYKARLRTLIELAHAKVRILDREQQARAALAMVGVELFASDVRAHDDYEVRLRAIVTNYPGTTAADLAQVNLVTLPRLTPESLEALDAIAARHPGTEIAAKALYGKAFHLAHNAHAIDPGGRSGDFTERFFEVLRITRELERLPFETPAWGDQPVDLVLQFRPSTGLPLQQSATVSPENLVRLLEAYRAFARDHLTLLDQPRHGRSMEHWLGFTVPMFVVQGGDLSAADRWFDDVEGAASDPAPIRFLRAQWLARAGLGGMPVPSPRPTDAGDSRRLMAQVAMGQGRAARRALVALANQALVDEDLPTARERFAEYAERFPDVAEAWMAGLRLSQVDHILGRYAEAARGFDEVAAKHAAVPFARVLGYAYAARSLEAAGRFEEARVRYADAVAAWKPPVQEWLSAGWPPARTVTDPFTIRRPDVTRRVAQLTRVLPLPDGQALARAQWLVTNLRPEEARRELEGLVGRGPRSASAAEARLILHRAQLDEAVALASTDAPSLDMAGALRRLDSLTREPFDSAIALASVVRATLLMLDGQRTASETAMTSALEAWIAGGARAPAPATGSLAEDALAVRDAVFQPLGGRELNDPRSRWSAFKWPTALPRFIIAPATLRVREGGQDVPTDIDVSRRPPGLPNVLFVDADDVEYLTALVPKLGGSRRREPTAIMEVPNQPIGGAMEIIRWWDGFFPTRPGHWGGVEILTYPAFTSVEFTDTARTKALVPVTIGYSGATLVLEKIAGVWTITALVNQWVT